MTDEKPWKCENHACQAGDNGTRYHNRWHVTVEGESGETDMPEIAEVSDYLDLQVELCDRCARSPQAIMAALSAAVAYEMKALRCLNCRSVVKPKQRYCQDCREDPFKDPNHE
ncbi:MAG TPA: hypothetical protein VJT85_00080 [Gemmatimonadaceae bacterium]|nr:hypothetical protein [Gemmatimonadaceae bacterium]